MSLRLQVGIGNWYCQEKGPLHSAVMTLLFTRLQEATMGWGAIINCESNSRYVTPGSFAEGNQHCCGMHCSYVQGT